jgi:transcriptional regulator with XRE-family HTH domain
MKNPVYPSTARPSHRVRRRRGAARSGPTAEESAMPTSLAELQLIDEISDPGTTARPEGGEDAEAGRRAELGAFLRSRRARISPRDVGLDPGGRRRTPGLRREELAALAGVGVTWYTRLEQGRPINASVQVVDAIARTLRLDGAEWQHLYHLAGLPTAPPTAEPLALDPTVRTVLDAVELPAAVYSERYDVLAWNAAYGELFPTLVRTPPPYRNVLWDVFTTRRENSPWLNRDVGLPHMVATLRAAFGRHVGEAAWSDFVRRLSQASEEFSRMWASCDVAGLGTHTKVFRHPAVGELNMATASFPVSGVHEARLVVYTPLDDATRRAMTVLSKTAAAR